MEPMRIKRHPTLILVGLCVLMNTIVVSSENGDIVFSQTEESQPGTYVGEVLGKTDLKQKYPHDVGKLRFNFMNPTDAGVNFFRITAMNGEIYTKQVIDRDTLCDVVSTCCPDTHGCFITLIVGVSPQEFFAIYNVRIDIIDVNDNKPVFPESSITLKISESAPINTSLIIPIASDLDSGRNGIRRYTIQAPSNTFGIKEYKTDNEINDVAIINLKKLDRETQSLYGVKVFAVDGGIPQNTGTLAVNIEVSDANDNRPVFRNSGYTVSIRENVAVNSTILQIQADDPDIGINGKVRFSISRRASSKVKDTFSINPSTGWIKVKQKLNYEGTKVYHIPVEAKDMGPGSLPSRTTVAVHIIDVNDNSPTIHVNMLSKSGKAEVKESEKAGEIVAHILIQDIDTGQNGKVSCSVDNSYFLLIRETNISNQDVYRLITAAPLNRETTPEYRVTIVCQDMGEPKLESRETFAVRLLDVNDNAPAFTRRTYTASINENNNPGVFLLQVKAHDQDVGLGGTVRYDIAADGAGLVTINQEGKIYASTVYDREQYTEIMFHVAATDNGEVPLSTSATVMLRINDQNDNAPYFLDDYTFNVSENAAPQVVIGKVEAKDHDVGKNREVDFRLANDNDEAFRYFEITRKGIVITRTRLDREHRPEYQLNVLAVDRGDKPQTSTTVVKVKITDKNDNAPKILFPSRDNNTVYISYLEHIAQAFTRVKAVDYDTGLNAELLYFIVGNNENSYFSIDEHTGVLRVNKQMTINDAGDYKLTIQVQDKGHPVKGDSARLTIVVDGTGKPITITGAYIEKQPNNKNLIIVICLASVSGVLAIVLIIAIVCIRKKDIQNHNYNVKTETQRIFNNKRNSPTNSHNSAEDLKSPSPPPKKEVSFSIENDDFVENNHSTFKAPRQNWNPNMSTTYEPTRTCRSLTQDKTLEKPSMYDSNRTFRQQQPSQKCCDTNIHEPKLKPLIDLKQTHCDTGSDSSANHGSVDSGRGESVENNQLAQLRHVSEFAVPPPLREVNGGTLYSDDSNSDHSSNNNNQYYHHRTSSTDSSSSTLKDRFSKSSRESVDPELLCVEIDHLFFTEV